MLTRPWDKRNAQARYCAEGFIVTFWYCEIVHKMDCIYVHIIIIEIIR